MIKPLFSPVENYIIPLTSILKNNDESIKKVSDSLTLRGYTFIRLPNDLISQIDKCLIVINNFFDNTVQYKKRFFKEPIFGYFNVSHKESFRMLTGARLNEHTFPPNFDKIKDLINTVDKLIYSIAILLSPTLFPNLLSEAQKLKIPFFEMKKQWGMFDIAKYHNDGKRIQLNCKEHYDPGLLSLSLRSTEPGLQLKDEFGKWIIPPNDNTIAVLWTGNAATQMNSKIKQGVHRVVNPKVNKIGMPRIAIWHEICTTTQEHTELINKTQTKAITYENNSGIPMSKSGLPRKLTQKDKNNIIPIPISTTYKIPSKYKSYVDYRMNKQCII